MRDVGEWQSCLPVLYVGGSYCAVSISLSLHMRGVDALRVKSLRTNNEKNKERGSEKKRTEVKPQATNQMFHFLSTWQSSGIVITGQSRWISSADIHHFRDDTILQ